MDDIPLAIFFATLKFTLPTVHLFLILCSYVNTFVAQYSGAGRNNRIGPSVWQGLYFAFFAGLAILPLYPLAPKIFSMAGHAPELQKMEIHACHRIETISARSRPKGHMCRTVIQRVRKNSLIPM